MTKLGMLLVICLQFSAFSMGNAQNMKVSLDMRDVTLEEVLKALRDQTGMRFFYSVEKARLERKEVVKVSGNTLDEVLQKVLENTKLTYEIQQDVILIKDRPQEQAQRGKVTGKVADENGNPLPGVTVVIKGTHYGTATDEKGCYELTLPIDKPVLLFSMVGMETKEVAVDGNTEVNVVLVAEVGELEDVVVTGYFNKSKNSFTGAVTQAKREELRKFGNVNLIQALSMVDPSFKIKENNLMGSDPNTLPDFFVRGESSFMGESNVPTFIVDGYEVSLQRVFDMDMERIESITILKDASATILYGSRAASGVVVIETRRPASGRLQVSYSNRTSLSVADLSDYDLMDAQEKLDYELKADIYDMKVLNDLKHIELLKSNVEKGVNTDWLAQPIRNVVSHAHSLYIDGGTDAVVYGLGLNYNRNAGVMKESYREVFGTSFDLTYRIRDKVSIRNSFEFSQTNVKNSPYGSFSLYAAANPYNPIYDEEGKLIDYYEPHLDQKQTDAQYVNPLYNATLPFKNEESIQTITDNLSIDYWILPELRFRTDIALTKTMNSSDKYISPEHTDYKDVDLEANQKGEYTKGAGKGFSYNINATLNYNLQKNRHVFFTGIGMNFIQNQHIEDFYTAVGFLDERFNEVWFGSMFEEEASLPDKRKRIVWLVFLQM